MKINNKFNQVSFDVETKKTYETVQEGFTHLSTMIETAVGGTSEQAMIQNKLEEAYYWTVGALNAIQFAKNAGPVVSATSQAA